jgi:hypothetical protein
MSFLEVYKCIKSEIGVSFCFLSREEGGASGDYVNYVKERKMHVPASAYFKVDLMPSARVMAAQNERMLITGARNKV